MWIYGECPGVLDHKRKEVKGQNMIDFNIIYTKVINNRATGEFYNRTQFYSELRLALSLRSGGFRGEIFDEELKVPRLSGHQTKRNNINANINQNPMEWFKITIFIPFLDHIIQELKSRFSDKFVKVIPLEGLIPIHKDSYSTEAILNAAMFYEQDLLSSSDLVLKAEINLWKTKWNKIETNIPHTALSINLPEKKKKNAIRGLVNITLNIYLVPADLIIACHSTSAKRLLYAYELHVITTSSCHLTVPRTGLNALTLLPFYIIYNPLSRAFVFDHRTRQTQILQVIVGGELDGDLTAAARSRKRLPLQIITRALDVRRRISFSR
ncbi:hypothetical protein QTP88_017993 [Uroleucon formosanum]